MTADEGTFGRLIAGLLRAVKALLSLHVETAKQEATDDLGRVGGGLLLLVFALFVFFIALLFLHVAGAMALHTYANLDIWAAMLIVTGIDLLVGTTAWLMGRSRLRKPVLKKTRKLVGETVKVLGDL